MRSPSSCEIVSLSIPMPDLIITSEITAPSHASRDKPKSRNMPAATRVDADMTESSVASSPEFIRESDFTFTPTPFT